MSLFSIDTSKGFAFSCDGVDFYNGWYGGYVGQLTVDNEMALITISNEEVITNADGQDGIEFLARYKIYKARKALMD